MFFGGINGITAFHPDEILTQEKKSKKLPPLIITSYEKRVESTGLYKNHLDDLLLDNTIRVNTSEK